MDSNKKLEKVQPEPQILEVRQVREISKDELKEIAGGCGDMGGVVVIRF